MPFQTDRIRIPHSRLWAILCALCLSLSCFAQQPLTISPEGEGSPQAPLQLPSGERETDVPVKSIGYLSYDSALTAMPDYIIAQSRLKELRQAFDTELNRVEQEFNQKYEAFLDGLKDFPRTIMLKRQTELQQMMQSNIEFKEKCRKEMEAARKEALTPLRQRLNEAIATIARQHGLALVINTDGDASPYIDPQRSIDITGEVMKLLSH